MSRRRPVPAAHAAVVVLLAACSYDVDAEYSRVIEVDADRPCPDGDAVAEDEGFDSGELASERVVLRRRPLCWYRVEDRSERGLCTGTWKELLASDDHAGTKACEYVIEGRRTRRPFSCGGNGTALN